MYNERNDSFSVKAIILKLLFLVLFVFLLLWLLPKVIKFPESQVAQSPNLDPFYDQIYINNITAMKEAAISYYTLQRLPQKVGDKVSITLAEMLEKKLLIPFTNKDGNACDVIESYVEVEKLEEEYLMKVQLSCPDKTDYILVYLGCYDYCEGLVCEKKDDTPKDPGTQTKPTPKPNNPKPSNPTPDKPDPEPEKPKPVTTCTYKYTKHVDTQYSSWSNWSDPIVYVDADNIQFGTTNTKEVVKLDSKQEQVGSKTKYSVVTDENQPMYREEQVQIGSRKVYYCANTDLFVDEERNVYTSTSWKDAGQISSSTAPVDTLNEKYTYAGIDYSSCNGPCDSGAKLYWNKQTRTTTVYGKIEVINNVSVLTTTNTINCTEFGYTEMPIMGTKKTYVGDKIISITKTEIPLYAEIKYYKERTRTVVKEAYDDVKYSSSANDTNLIKQGYKYVSKSCTTK